MKVSRKLSIAGLGVAPTPQATSPRRSAAFRKVGKLGVAAGILLVLSLCFARPGAAQVTIYVTTAAQGVTDPTNCSLQEAIYSSEFKLNVAISSTNPDVFYTTGCVPGTGNGDTIALRPFDVLIFDHSWTDAHNYTGPTATPIIFSNITIQGNGATLQWIGSGNSRLFAVGDVSINDANFVASGSGELQLENVNVVGFHVKGGDGGSNGGGGGLGAGGAIYVAAGSLTVSSCTFSYNGAVGGNGSGGGNPSGGGGGLSGNGGSGADTAGGGGGGGARGNGGSGGGFGSVTGGGGGGGGTVESGGDGTEISASSGMGGAGGYLCGGNGGNAGNDGQIGQCAGGGGGGGGLIYFSVCSGFGCSGDGLTGAYGGGGGGGPISDGGSGGFGGGGGGGNGGYVTSGGHGGFGGGGGGACCASIDTSPGGAGEWGGNANGSNGGGGGGLGGAIFSGGGNVLIENSTFTDNSVVGGAGGDNGPNDGGKAAGGAIFVLNGDLTIRNSTISGNQTSDIGGGVTYFVQGTCNGTCLSADSIFTLNNTIIANNGYKECAVLGHSGGGQSLSYTGYGNLITSNDSDGPCPGVVSTSDPNLQPLNYNNPGSTPTMAILTNSPAVDAADSGTSLSVDQRGVTRPQLNGYDIGAYEARPPGFTIGPFQPIPVVIGGAISAAVTVNSLEYFSAPVTLSVATPPAGVTVSFSPNPITPAVNSSASSTMIITLAPTVTPGTYTPTISAVSTATATSGVLSHSVPASVDVTATTGGISTVIGDFAAAGAIKDPVIVHALNLELNIAQECIKFGDVPCAVFTLGVMLFELHAESGRHITPSAAAVLITDTQALQSSLFQEWPWPMK